jgi:hypothetical protein
MMLSVVLLPIQRALITPLRIFLQRSWPQSQAKFPSPLRSTPPGAGFFFDLFIELDVCIALKSPSLADAMYSVAVNERSPCAVVRLSFFTNPDHARIQRASQSVEGCMDSVVDQASHWMGVGTIKLHCRELSPNRSKEPSIPTAIGISAHF